MIITMSDWTVCFQEDKEKTVIETPTISPFAGCAIITVEFWYHAYGAELEKFRVELVDTSSGDVQEILYHNKEPSVNKWKYASSSFNVTSDFKVSVKRWMTTSLNAFRRCC